jgi:hypothetical protein
MRYMIQFADRTSKIVSEQEGQAALAAWAQGRPLVLRGAGYAHHLISAIRPMSQWAQDRVEEATKEGKKLCRFGTVHERLSDCLCKTCGKDPVPELAALLPPPRVELPEAPPTPKERERAAK